jgi:hypothetical protein
VDSLKRLVEQHGWASPRAQARVAGLVADEADWTDRDVTDAAWLLRYIDQRREEEVGDLAREAQRLWREHRAVSAERRRLAEPWDVREAALRERMATAAVATPAPDLEAVGLSVATAWKGRVVDVPAFLGALASGIVSADNLAAVKFHQPALDALARGITDLVEVPGFESERTTSIRAKRSRDDNG